VALASTGTALAPPPAPALESGDPRTCLDCWAQTDDVTLNGAWGPIDKDQQAVTDTFR
jgi:hypothetical protein